MAAPNPNYDELITTTLENRRKKLSNIVLQSNVLYQWLRKQGRIDYFDGGRYLGLFCQLNQ